MTGRASPVVPFLQSAGTWSEMKKAFVEYFEVDEEVVLSELKAMYCEKFDVSKYTTQFNQVMTKHQWTPADQKNLKEAYIEGLPYKVKEVLTIHRNTTNLTLAKLQRDANEINSKQQKLYHENRPPRDDSKQDRKDNQERGKNN